MDNNYRIDTGNIFICLTNEWKKYDRNFLRDRVRVAIESTLISKKIVSIAYDGTNAAYLETFVKVRYSDDLGIAKDSSNFPFPDYFLMPQRNSPHHSIIDYSEPCILTTEDNNYDLFFALKLSLTDIMEETEDFLKFHLEGTFENNLSRYKSYLVNLCIKYSEFLQNKYEPLINRFLESYVEEKKKDVEIKEDFVPDGNKEFTLARQVLAINYLLDAQGVNKNVVDLTQKARFIQFLTGRETGAENINNTTLYKKVKGEQSKSRKLATLDLQFVREYFVRLRMQAIVDIIDTDIKKI